MYSYLTSGPNELQKSIIYDDWGRLHTFEFNLPRGIYNVTVSVGWSGRTCRHQRIVVEGITFVDDEATPPDTPYLVRTRRVTVDDCSLSLEMGIFDEYTMLNDMNIEVVSSSPFELMVEKTGSGTGTVASTPTGIDCGTQCNAPFDAGTQVELVATAPQGAVFTGWSGDCSGTDACWLDMNAARSVTASFAIAVADRDGDGDVDGQDLAGYSADLADGIDVLQVAAFAAIFGEE
jgi:hypothetical protein